MVAPCREHGHCREGRPRSAPTGGGADRPLPMVAADLCGSAGLLPEELAGVGEGGLGGGAR